MTNETKEQEEERMTFEEVFILKDGLVKAGRLQRGVRFHYAIFKNLKKVQREVKLLEKILEPTPDFKTYDKERTALNKRHSKKDEKGNPVIVPGPDLQPKHVFKDFEKWEEESEILKGNHEKAIQEREEQIDEYNDMMKKEIDQPIQFFMIDESYWAKEVKGEMEFLVDGLTAEFLWGIKEIIKE